MEEEYNQLSTKKNQEEERKRSLEAEWQKERDALDTSVAEQKAAVEEAQHTVQEMKDKREQTEQENHRLKEEIALCKKKQEDDKKAVERRRKELVKLDEQLKVSEAQIKKLQECHHDLLRQLEEEKARTESEEYKLKVHL
jgi:chromosome segregation ATPase